MTKRKRKYTPQEEVQLYAEEIIKSIDRFNDILKNGCNDPAWTDGHNMKLARNHVLYFKRKIETLCEENELPLPPEYTLPTPPEVNPYFMAKTDSDRFKKLNGKAYFNGRLTNQPFKCDTENVTEERYDIDVYFGGQIFYEVAAETEDEAIEKALSLYNNENPDVLQKHIFPLYLEDVEVVTITGCKKESDICEENI